MRASLRLASATGRESLLPRASRLKRSSKVPIDPPSRKAGWPAAHALRSSTSDRLGTIRYGSRGSASRYRRSRSETFPALAGPVMRFRPNWPTLVGALQTDAETSGTLKAAGKGLGRRLRAAFFGRLPRLATTWPGHLPGAGIAEIGLLGTAPRVREVDPHHGSFCLFDFLAAIVADQPRNTCHGFPPSQSRFPRCA